MSTVAVVIDCAVLVLVALQLVALRRQLRARRPRAPDHEVVSMPDGSVARRCPRCGAAAPLATDFRLMHVAWTDVCDVRGRVVVFHCTTCGEPPPGSIQKALRQLQS